MMFKLAFVCLAFMAIVGAQLLVPSAVSYQSNQLSNIPNNPLQRIQESRVWNGHQASWDQQNNSPYGAARSLVASQQQQQQQQQSRYPGEYIQRWN